MSEPLQLPKYSIGVGDRFAHQAKAQLLACQRSLEAGVLITPVWNKSNREHLIIGSEPSQARAAADAAVKALGWNGPYFVDADHINLKTADRFLAPCNFFTMDVAEDIGRHAAADAIDAFVGRHPELIGQFSIPRIQQPFDIDESFVRRTAGTFLAAVQQAGQIYRDLAGKRGEGTFIPEISMDETEFPQTPPELLVILAAIADEQIPIQTIAPKFAGRFNKGVDYVGDVRQFAKEFRDDLATIAFAIRQYGLPGNLKLSIHSGSDKYSIYPAIREGIREFDAGVHLKTAGTTWLEEVIGLAEAGGEGLELAKEIYLEAYLHASDLCAPYSAVIDIDRVKLPAPTMVSAWTSDQFVRALRHDGNHDPQFNPDLRQLLHVGFKVAAKMGRRFTNALEANQVVISKNVTTNLFERHIKPIFLA
jgi:tagaturonate epimerase